MIRWNFNPNAAKDEGGFSMDAPGNPASDRMHLEIRWRNSRIFPSPVFGGSGVQSAAMEAEDAVREMLGSWGPPGLHTTGALVKANMRRELKRLLSLRDWPCPGTVSPQQLARAGFFYLGPSDRVQCFCCGGILRSWEPGDQPDIEHRKFFPSCPFVLGTEVGNVPLPSPASDTDSVDGQILGQLHRLPGEQQGEDEEDAWRAAYPDLMEERQRMATYRTWPQYTGVSPDLLAAAGFFYTGQRDNVRCFHCDGELRNWERGDDPWREHAKWFPRCEFLVQSMGPAYIRSVQEATGSSPASSPESQRSSDRSPSTSSGSPGHWQDFLQSSIVQEALQMGFDESLVVSLVQSRFLLVGTPYNCLSELVTELVDEAAQAEEESVQLTQEPARIPEGSAQRAASESPKQPGTTLNTEEQLRRLKEERMCKVCMDKDVSMVFVPCGHLVVCMDCAPNLRHCPICRATIRGSMRAFMS